MFSSSLFSLFLKRKKFDACFVFQSSPVFMASAGVVLKKLYKVPLCVWVQDLWPETLSATKRLNMPVVEALIRRFSRMVYKSASVVFTQSKAFDQSIRRLHPNAHLVYLPSPCDECYRPIDPSVIIPTPGMPAGFNVMFTGNLGVAQALPTLIAAAKIVKERYQQHDIKWIFVGVGSELATIKTEVAKLDLENDVIFLGSYPVTEMPNIMAQASIFIASLTQSTIFSQVVPLKIQSYMASGKPIITAIDGEVKRIIEEAGCGIAVNSENSSALAEAVYKLRQMSNDERQKMGNAARHYYETHFKTSEIIERLCNVVEQQVCQKSNAIYSSEKNPA